MGTIVETIQEIVRQEMRRVRVAELGLVESVFPHSSGGDTDNYACDVKLKNSGLALKRVPLMTGHVGTVAIPNVGDLVLLTFDKGDINQPIVVGRLYNEKQRPPLNSSDEVIFRLPLAEADDKTIKAAIRNLNGNSPPRELIFEMPPKITVRVTDGTVRATAGKTEMKLDQPDGSGGTVTVVAGRTKITMNQDGDVTVEAAGSMKLKATRDMTLEAMNIKIKSQVETSIEAGTSATLKGNVGATVNGGVSATVQGATISVKGITSFSP
ncbi:MAG TPA: phage baseplate assembly protein V [Pyrinomonadaceae bacterium]